MPTITTTTSGLRALLERQAEQDFETALARCDALGIRPRIVQPDGTIYVDPEGDGAESGDYAMDEGTTAWIRVGAHRLLHISTVGEHIKVEVFQHPIKDSDEPIVGFRVWKPRS